MQVKELLKDISPYSSDENVGRCRGVEIPCLLMSHLVPFHSGQVRNFYLLVLGQVKINLQFCTSISYLVVIINLYVAKKTSVDPEEANRSGSTLFSIVFDWFHFFF